MAKLGSRLNGIQEARGSNPLISTIETLDGKSGVSYFYNNQDNVINALVEGVNLLLTHLYCSYTGLLYIKCSMMSLIYCGCYSGSFYAVSYLCNIRSTVN